MVSAIVFDFDGVLADSEPLHFRAFRDVLATLGLTLTETAYYARYLGFDDVGAFRAMAGDGRVALSGERLSELVAQKAARMELLERGASVLFPGAREAVVRMAGRGLIAIASGALRAEIVRVLEREGLRSYFPVLVSAEDTQATKPDPAPYARAVELLAATSGRRVLPAECVAVEDSRWGLQSARAAGLRTVAVSHSYPAEDLAEADAVIGHLDLLTWDLLGGLN